jgi:FkbM family methyltransferase
MDIVSSVFSRGPVVIFGAARMGRAFLDTLRSNGVEVAAFSDNAREKWGAEIGGVNVIDPDTLRARHRTTPVLIASLLGENEMYHQLTDAGFTSVYPLSVLHHARPDVFVAPYLDGAWESADSADAREGARLWADDESRTVYDGIMEYRRTRSMDVYPRIQSHHPQYFPPGLIRFTPRDVFLDGGAFEGDTLQSFMSLFPDAKSAYCAFEPDPTNYEKLCATGARYPGRFVGVNAGLGAVDGVMTFTSGGGVDRTFTNDPVGGAKQDIPVHTIDRFFGDKEPPTFIKMDIEAMEPEAVRGAERTIRATAPTLAICVYHRPEHLWEIPQTVRAWRPDYRLYLRHYSTNMSETVMFAIASSRALSYAPSESGRPQSS